ncbi:hypothetical protein T01_14708 [Trichinella spiralis]|uniref:Uncharacterized protein n=1 Tax=Trichinella spiralis TaxID=6334 RepID=A0A0V0Z8F5_TRISP|nr:hypothetical protein T01_14708 [Trichinella spiralis]
MPQNNDEHGGSGRNFLQVVSSRMAAVSSTALELLSKRSRQYGTTYQLLQ